MVGREDDYDNGNMYDFSYFNQTLIMQPKKIP